MGLISIIKDIFFTRSLPYSRDLVEEATKWIGIHEKKGENSRSVDPFRRAIDNVAEGEPWCAAFVGYCVRAVQLRTDAKIKVYLSELSTDMWYKTPEKYRLKDPKPGSIVIWQYPNSIHGHTGIVVSVKDDRILTIEGNTKSPGNTLVSGTGVYTKSRSRYGTPDMRVVGFVQPFER